MRPAAESRASIIETVQTPLGFFALVVLVVEAIFGIIAAMSEGTDRTYLVVGMLVLIFLLVVMVGAMAVLRPESLRGSRPHPLAEPPTRAESPLVHRLESPTVLCAATKQFEQIGFTQDVKLLKRMFPNVQVEHEITGARLRALLTSKHYDVLHIAGYVRPEQGTLVFEDGKDLLSADGLAGLLDVSGVSLLVLATCDSIDLAAKVSRRCSIVAATAEMSVDAFIAWAECFYGMLSRGHSLSRAYDVARTTTDAPMVLLMKQDLAFS